MLLPISLGSYFEIDRCAEEHSHFTRHHLLVNTPGNIAPRIKCRTRIGEKSLQFVGSKLWSELPTDIKDCGSYNVFKRNYKKSLIGLTESGNVGQ